MTDNQPFLRLREPFPKAKVQQIKQGGLTLDYVGHADVTERLLEVDPHWSWEPVAFGPDGLPAFDADGGLWIRLTVLGVTRFGYGEPQGRNSHDAKKGAIGNAIRNAAMRFGVALQLWQKDNHEAAAPVWEAIEKKAKAEAYKDEPSEWTQPAKQRSFGGRPASEQQRKLVQAKLRNINIHREEQACQVLTEVLKREVKSWGDLHHADIDTIVRMGEEGLQKAFYASMGMELIPNGNTDDDPWKVTE